MRSTSAPSKRKLARLARPRKSGAEAEWSAMERQAEAACHSLFRVTTVTASGGPITQASCWKLSPGIWKTAPMLRRKSDRRRLLMGAALTSLWMARRLAADSTYRVRNKVVLITGGSRGLGLALAREVTARRGRIAICGRDLESLERARASLARVGAEVLALSCDVTDPESARQLVAQVTDELGP